MSANFEAGVTYGSRSWHGEETNRAATDDRRFSVEETISEGLDWYVTKRPLAIAGSEGDLAGTAAPGCYGVFRTDTWQCLGGVGEDYRELQNREIFAQFQPFLDARALEFTSCGSLDGGRRVYVQARLAVDAADIGGGDIVEPMLLIASSHDGSLATRVGFTPQRVVCQNTLAAAISGRNGRELLKIRHTRGQHDKLAGVMATVDAARMQWADTADTYRRLALARVSVDAVRDYACAVLDIDPAQRYVKGRKGAALDRVMRLARYGRGQSPGELTAWAAYNGVTEWTSHYRQSKAEARQKSVWFGASEATNRKALELAVQLAA